LIGRRTGCSRFWSITICGDKQVRDPLTAQGQDKVGGVR
jgi:hypothetical protein